MKKRTAAMMFMSMMAMLASQYGAGMSFFKSLFRHRHEPKKPHVLDDIDRYYIDRAKAKRARRAARDMRNAARGGMKMARCL